VKRGAAEGSGGDGGGGEMGRKCCVEGNLPFIPRTPREVTLTSQKIAIGRPRLPPFPPHAARHAPAGLHRENDPPSPGVS
jgi:hypothetical protein